MLLIDLIICIIYIYSIIVFSIFIKPTIFIVSPFFVYCFVSTWIIISGDKKNVCKYDIKNKFYRAIIIFFYSFACVSGYYFIHNSWEIFKNNFFYKTILILSPIFYFIGMQFLPILFDCNYSFLYFFLETILYKVLTFRKNFLNNF